MKGQGAAAGDWEGGQEAVKEPRIISVFYVKTNTWKKQL